MVNVCYSKNGINQIHINWKVPVFSLSLKVAILAPLKILFLTPLTMRYISTDICPTLVRYFHPHPDQSGTHCLTLLTLSHKSSFKSIIYFVIAHTQTPDFTSQTFPYHSFPLSLGLVSLRARIFKFLSPNILPASPFFSSCLQPHTFRHPSLILQKGWAPLCSTFSLPTFRYWNTRRKRGFQAPFQPLLLTFYDMQEIQGDE